MHVALNMVFLVPGETGGMETYARELIPPLASHVRLTALVPREAAGLDLGCETEVVPVDARNRAEWVRGEQQHVPRIAKRIGADVVHSLASTAPLWGAQPRVTTIHDLNYKLVADAHEGIRGYGMRLLVPAAARRSTRIIAPSEATKRDLETHLGIAPEKVDVAPEAASPKPKATPTPEALLREKFGLGDRRILLSVSGKKPSKNLLRLLEALAGIEDRPLLVLPGYATPHEAELRARAAALGIAADVVWPPWLETAELEGFYALADAFVFPSLYEGFGLPVLEAMARGVPVATSTRGSLAEVAGDAALTFDPEDVTAMRDAIERMLGDRELASRLREAGLAQAASFSWERCAALTAESYERTLAGA